MPTRVAPLEWNNIQEAESLFDLFQVICTFCHNHCYYYYYYYYYYFHCYHHDFYYLKCKLLLTPYAPTSTFGAHVIIMIIILILETVWQ